MCLDTHTRGVSDRKLARATVEIRSFAFLTQRARKNSLILRELEKNGGSTKYFDEYAFEANALYHE